MFGRRRRAKNTVAETVGVVADARDTAIGYADPLMTDDKLRKRLAAAISAGAAARSRVRRQSGWTGFGRRLATDEVLRAQLVEMALALQAAQRRVKNARRTHRLRNTIVFVSGVGMMVAATPKLRTKVLSLVGGGSDEWAPAGWTEPKATTITEEIEVEVPVPTAYNQWTQFEDFPRFMDGVDEVRQLDDTLLHWAATVGGKHAEWDAKIIEQEPDRRITWESTDGKYTRGSVTFEEAGVGRSRIHLQMTYTRDGVAERVGSAVGLDSRRIRGDLQRFRDLIESQGAASGSWRGEIHAEQSSNDPSSRGN